jgi:hypothetical protein
MDKNTKLAINLIEGTVQVEGDEAFVRSVYEDFKDYLGKHLAIRPAIVTVNPSSAPAPARITDESNPSKRRSERKSSRSDEKSRTAEYRPKFRSDLDLSELESTYDAFNPRNHHERILVFAVFLRERFKMVPCTADDIYTCYGTMKSKTETPEAFVQAFRDAQNKAHYIDFNSLQDIRITIAGDNYYNKKMQQSKGAAK